MKKTLSLFLALLMFLGVFKSLDALKEWLKK